MLVEMNFRFLDKLDGWGWWKLISSENDVWLNAVRVFYFFGNSFRLYEDGEEIDEGSRNDTIRTTVFGTELTVDEEVINRQLGFISSFRAEQWPAVQDRVGKRGARPATTKSIQST